jgi:hypothetical protein
MNTTNTQLRDAVHVGWHRANSLCRWVPVCCGMSAESVLGKLLDGTIRGGDKCVLAKGVDPNEDKQPYKRRRF